MKKSYGKEYHVCHVLAYDIRRLHLARTLEACCDFCTARELFYLLEGHGRTLYLYRDAEEMDASDMVHPNICLCLLFGILLNKKR